MVQTETLVNEGDNQSYEKTTYNLTSEIKDADGTGIGSNKDTIVQKGSPYSVDSFGQFDTDSALPYVMVVTLHNEIAFMQFEYASQSWNWDDDNVCTIENDDGESYVVTCIFQCPGS